MTLLAAGSTTAFYRVVGRVSCSPASRSDASVFLYFLPDREANGDGRPLTDHTVDGDGCALGFQQLFCDGKAEAAAAGLPGLATARRVCPVEAIKDTRQCFCWNALAGIPDANQHRSLPIALGSDIDPPARRREFEGVVDNIEQDLL